MCVCVCVCVHVSGVVVDKEAWLLHSLLDYYARTQSERCMDVIASLDDHHVRVRCIHLGILILSFHNYLSILYFYYIAYLK